ncbi:MAG: hypothetical protein ABIK45_03040 [Pseudomonadota bacterium]
MEKPWPEEAAMTRKTAPFDWKYLLRPEGADSETPSRLAGACKTVVWLGVSILLGVGMGHL